jgi:two-component system alkaline phosphatase synthesis response regulator PhoP
VVFVAHPPYAKLAADPEAGIIMLKKRILLIEDDPDIQHLVDYNLSLEGFEVRTASEGLAGLETARRTQPDLILLDVMLPGLAGKEICKKLKENRSTASIPVIFLTAKTNEIDKMIGFELGADDYVTKPFSPRELAARVKAVLRRAQPQRDEAPLVFGDLRVDYEKRQVSFRETPLLLSALEFNLFYLLASTPSRVYTRDELLDRVWKGESFVSLRTVDVHVRRLRSKIEQIPGFPRCIQTLRSIGYKFEWPS